MKANNGHYPATPTPRSSAGLTTQNRGSQPKLYRRLLTLSLVLVGNILVHLPGTPVLALPRPLCTRMKEGSSGENVEALQQALNRFNKKDIEVDEDFGPETRRAVEVFQTRVGITADGVVGRDTCEALLDQKKSPFSGIDPSLTSNPGTFVGVLLPPSVPPGGPRDQRLSFKDRNQDNTYQDNAYYVVVPFRGDPELLERVRNVVSGGVQRDETRLGSFVRTEGYSHRYDAESASYELRKEGFDARVVRF